MVFLTKLRPEPMGAYDASAAYGVNSLVMSADGAAAYISVRDVPAGTPLTNTDYWKMHTDLTTVKQSAETAAAKANAARDEMLEIVRNLTGVVEMSGNSVQAELVGGLPFDRLATVLAPVQSGSGDPSPDNVRPISGWTGAQLTRCGKNLINDADLSGIVLGYVHNLENPFRFAGTYTISAHIAGEAGQGLTFSLMQGTSNIKQYSVSNDSPAVIEITDDILQQIDNCKIYTWSGSVGSTLDWIMLNQGSTAATYEPYQGDTYTAEFGQTVYGGTLDWQTGVLTAGWAMEIMDGSSDENWKYSSGIFYSSKIADMAYMIADSLEKRFELSSHYVTSPSTGYPNMSNGEFAVGMKDFSSSPFTLIRDSRYTDVDSFKSFLAAQYAAGTPVQVCYKLAEPVTIQLTAQEIKQLQGVNTLHGDGSIEIIGRFDKAIALDARIAALEAAALAE